MQRVAWFGLALVCTLAIASASASAPSLQALIDATPRGATLRLAPGVYAGPATIRVPMVVEGDHHAVIQGNGRGTVLSVEAQDVTLRGLRFQGSGIHTTGSMRVCNCKAMGTWWKTTILKTCCLAST